MKFTIEQIAQVCHETNAAYCAILKDYSQQPWKEAPAWQRESAIAGVKYLLDPKTNRSASCLHDNWVKDKLDAGWTYGSVKDGEKKTHPCLIPFQHLPVEQQIKDLLFMNVVWAMTQQ